MYLSLLILLFSCFNPSPKPLQNTVSQPNVVLIVGCTLRQDRLTPYGSKNNTAPFLNQLAKMGALFERHYAQAPWTRPSLGSILTGYYPRRLNLDSQDRSGQSRILSQEWSTIAEFLKDAGYHTIGSTSNPNALARFGFDQGFNTYKDTQGTTLEGVLITSAQKQAELIIKELSTIPPEIPFYAQVMTVDTHLKVHYEKEDWTALFGHKYRSKTKQQKRIDAYDASIHYWDRHIKILYSEIKARHPDTLFIITADHGEGLNHPKHHGDGHGNYLYPSTIHVPHLWVHPSIPAQRVTGITRNIDILPTLLEFLNLDSSDHFDGQSYLSVLLEGGDTPAEFSIAETFFRNSNKASIVTNDHHLIRDRKKSRTSLFSISDKESNTDLSTTEQNKTKELLEQLNLWEESTPKGYGESISITPEEKAMLQSMGYLD